MEKLSKIGELNLQKFKTEIYTTQDVKALFKKEKTSFSTLIPAAWLWYDNELLEIIDENGDGKPDERFGKEFKIIYLSSEEPLEELEQEALFISKTIIKNIKLKIPKTKTKNHRQSFINLKHFK